jgi:predicted 2-oxoglutarate/Fe(II)-dependent dioxygenase YbiX
MNKYDIVTFQCFTQEQVKEINEKIRKNIVEKEPLTAAAQNASKIGDFFPVLCSPLMKLIHPWLYHCQQANRKIFGYDIFWDFHLDSLNYNVYGVGGEYEWHVDTNSDQTPLDSKLTCLLNLSEETYEGGEFYAITSNEKKEFTTGMGLIFTSLIAHKVTPITKGERISLAYWAQGPSWR